jgi:FixJ family two-component response regulator
VFCRKRVRETASLSKKRQHIKVPLISVVDDDRSVVEAMVSLIQSVGYKAKGFRSAEDFLKSRQLLNTACLILDVRMPSMGGFELQRWLAAGNYRIPIIFITAYDSDDVRIQAFQAGAAGVLCKPFSQESLFQAMRSALANQHDIQNES